MRVAFRSLALGGLIFAVALAACGSDDEAAPASTGTATASTASSSPAAIASPTATAVRAPAEPPAADAIVVSKRQDPPTGSPAGFCIRFVNPSSGLQHDACRELPRPSPAATPDPAQSVALDAIVQCWAAAQAGGAFPACWR